ncbi:hypothetical protein BO85DRAFT_467618 [Aspergillus piperis CBS 112811]|uniref:Aminoglycoside phosphotransferase domain-containing protein n=1 Tax=Aspergillus piperis CBS 112811 TaxID=1448313 RepID=A0A8G1R644_9EURO|nr:hypothetical protein BO85DRAFT_467618 [Aspergillus piperis CBS 112811]RAH59988.1 hypothetical protein BO85DRAFT_467618 [Aspergillus piperis CBS 112811]
MPGALPLLHRQISLSAALDDDDNVLQELSYPQRRVDFYTCRVEEVKDWISGSFNVCIPVVIDGQDGRTSKKVLMRFPLPYRVGESQQPGNSDEKIRCEAATYIWTRQNCPSISIPQLWGFAFAQGPCFTAIQHTSIFSRLKWYLHRVLSPLFGLKTGYLLLDHVGSSDAVMLSESWDRLRHDRKRRANLFRGLSQIILSLAQFPFDRIGSLTIDNHGIVKLTNRPITLRLHHLENESVPTNMDRDLVYSTNDSYYMDLLSYHDSRLRHVPNSIRDKADGEAQLSTLTIMRALLPHFSCRKHRRGPFIMTLTDLHQSNLFVDSDWNIKSLVDLEWTCSRPVEMLHPPYWLTSRGVDQLYEGEHLDAFSEIHAEFMEVFDQEEQNRSQAGKKILGLASIMRRGWATGSFWYFHALETPKGLYNIFLDHIQPRYSKLDDAGMVEFERTVSPYWTPDIQTFLDGKLKEKEIYEGHLRDAFSVAQEEHPT